MTATPFKLYNTLTRNVEAFTPLHAGKVGIYVCGVTPYEDSHIGHARLFTIFDAFCRFLRAADWQVKYVRNFTDIDDKIINRARELGEEPLSLAERYIQSFHKDMQDLGNESPNEEPRVSTHLNEIIALIEKLVANKVAYIGKSGDVLFDTTKFADYGKLSRKPLDELRAGARVEVSADKRNPTDFVLWKSAKLGEPAWPSPWGEGRPGWHIECSAMAGKHLGETIDIHAGGADLIFPHHENEIAQSEGAHGKTFSNYWMHLAFVQVNHEKMSKSLGNFTYIKDLLKKHTGEAVRLYFLQTHYRQPLDFTPEALEAAEKALGRIYGALARAEDVGAGKADKAAVENFFTLLADDFNTPAALAQVFALIASLNKALDEQNKAQVAADKATLLSLLSALGMGTYNAATYARGDLKPGAESALDAAAIENLIAERKAARDARNFARADEIRNELLNQGIVLEDAAGQTTWKRVG